MTTARHAGSASELYAVAYARSPVARSPRVSTRRLGRLAALAALGFAAAIALAVTVPTLLGLQSFTVLSGSMEPAIGTGDVVVVRKIDPLDARVGDVVTFRSPDDPTRMITHRVRRIEASGGLARFVTQGDANTGSEEWTVPTNGVIGRVEYRVPKLGYVTSRVSSTLGRFAFLVVPAVLLAVIELRRIWRTDPQKR